jgi:autotransporter-associated beta strand protein
VYTLSGGTNIVGAGGINSSSGLYTINLGGGTLASSASWASSLNMNLTNLNGSVTFDAAANMTNTLSGVLSGNGGLRKAGAGTLILSGTNTYAGATVVSNGTLTLNGSITNCTVAVGAGATFGGTGTLRWQAGQTVTVSGTLNINQLNLALGTAGRVPFGDWTVADYQNGTLTGSAFASVTGLPPYAKLVYDTAAKKIILKNRAGGTLIRVM